MATGETVGDMGEIALVERIRVAVGASGAQVEVGPGDDAAVLGVPDGRMVVTTDMLVEGRHFRRDWSSAEDIGHKAAAENLADLAAMGARPVGIVVALALPESTEVAWVDSFLDGLLAETRRGGAALVGGDLVSGNQVVVSVTALGELDGRPPVLRSGSQIGDVVALCGEVGRAAAGLAVLSRGFRSPRALVDAHRRPMPDYAAGPRAALAGATAMLDVSDGLLLDAARLARASGVCIDVDSGALPIPEAVQTTAAAYNLDPLTWVLGGGDDHALLATFGAADVPDGFAVIGRVIARGDGGESVDVRVDGEPVTPQGYEHFHA